MDFDFDIEEMEQEVSDFKMINDTPYLKVKRKLEPNQEFFVTHLEIKKKTGRRGVGGREIYELLDSVGRDSDGVLNRVKAENRVKFANKNGNEWFLVEFGIIVETE